MKTSCDAHSVEELIAYMPEEVSPPRTNGELNFHEPWESRAFGMAIALYDQKHYASWDDFRGRLAEQISAWEKSGHEDEGHAVWNYYDHWMSALERLVVETGMLDKQEIEARAEQFLTGERDEFY
ncbi:nitrile hydratase accessory protein [Paenibacillus abyssi]|uniref:Nitrile hydratase beta subunit-like N-terminal domain-containing protein n=1 Tax=Paenibacillus abyssi TaxID=1340531 RepID=A0A917FNE2_9BACL|nr:nitrile hydratase accessory protein [Paenibacillus abyssi]GGF94300.1 hypothetical protein GCM10010916_09570 [Paenibacillus abyssi]